MREREAFEGSEVKLHIPSPCLAASKNGLLLEFKAMKRVPPGYDLKPKRELKMVKTCVASRLERQFATLCLTTHTPQIWGAKFAP